MQFQSIETFSRTTTIHPGILGGRALWANRVCPRMNTIASHDQFEPKRIRENLVVNYNGSLYTSSSANQIIAFALVS